MRVKRNAQLGAAPRPENLTMCWTPALLGQVDERALGLDELVVRGRRSVEYPVDAIESGTERVGRPMSPSTTSTVGGALSAWAFTALRTRARTASPPAGRLGEQLPTR